MMGVNGMPYWGQVRFIMSSVCGAMQLTELSFGAACNMVPFSSLPLWIWVSFFGFISHLYSRIVVFLVI